MAPTINHNDNAPTDVERPNKRARVDANDKDGSELEHTRGSDLHENEEDEIDEVPDIREEVKASDLHLDTVCSSLKICSVMFLQPALDQSGCPRL